MNKHFFSFPESMSSQARIAFRIIAIFLGAVLVVTGFITFQAVQTQVWQLWLEGISNVILIGFIIAALVVTRRGNHELGIWLTFVPWLVALIITSATISGLGVLLLISVMLIILLVARQTLPPSQALALTILGAVTGFATLLVDLYIPIERIALPGFQNVIGILLPIITIAFGYNIFTQFRNYPLRSKLIVVSVASVLVAVGIQALITIRSISTSLQDAESKALLRAANQTANNIDEHINTELTTIRVAAQITDFEKFLGTPAGQRDERLESETAGTLQSLLKRDPIYILSYALISKGGINVLDTNSSAIGSNHANEDYFKHALETDLPQVSQIRFLPNGKSVLYFSSSIHDENGKIIGILLATYDATILQKWIRESNRLTDEQAFPILFDENHIRLAHGSSPDLIFKSVVPLDTKKLAELQAAGLLPNLPEDQLSTNIPELEQALKNVDTTPNFTTTLVVTGEEAIAGASVRLKTQPWLVAYFEPVSIYLAPAQAQVRTALIFAVVISLVVALAGAWVSETISTPIVRLTAIAEQVTAGNINIQAKVESGDEIGTLATAFNRMTQQLRDFIATLEERVAERTRGLELAAEVGRSVSQVRSLSAMLTDAVELIRKQFDLYYVQVYLVNPSQTYLTLEAGTGDVGRTLLERSHQLTFNTNSLNGRAAVEKKSVVIENTLKSVTFKPNPLLPDTRSEMAVPLIVNNIVVGVLDIQSEQEGALNRDLLPAFEALAGQLAIAIQNANFLAETQQARAEVEAQARRLVRLNWQDYMDAIHKPEHTGFIFEKNQVLPLTETGTPQQTGENTVVVPISITGETVGSLTVELDENSSSARSSELVEEVARQVAQHVESLRLLEAAERYRAEAEEASRRLTREGWKDYMQANAEETIGYYYNLKEVQPYSGNGDHQPDETTLGLPLKVRDEVIGKLAIQGLGTEDSEALELANAVAERLGTHIESLRQFEETRRNQIELDKRAQELAAVAEISTISSQELDIQKMLETVVHLTQRKFGYYHAHVFTFDENTEHLKIVACGYKEGDEHEGTHGATEIPLMQEQSLVARAARTRQAVIVNDVKNEPGWLPNPLLPDTASELAVPLVVGDQLLGVLDVQSDRINAFSDEDANIQTTLASQVATALQNAQSFAKAQMQAQRESTLNVISQKIQSATTVEAVLQIAARELGHALGAPMTIAQLSMKDTSSS